MQSLRGSVHTVLWQGSAYGENGEIKQVLPSALTVYDRTGFVMKSYVYDPR